MRSEKGPSNHNFNGQAVMKNNDRQLKLKIKWPDNKNQKRPFTSPVITSAQLQHRRT